MLSAIQDVEYMQPYPVGYVASQIRPRIKDLKVGQSIQFEPLDYLGIPMLHFHNTLMSIMASEYGGNSVRIRFLQRQGVIEAVRLY